jgi:hypothetical protein
VAFLHDIRNYFFCIPPEPEPTQLIRKTDPGTRIRTKTSQIRIKDTKLIILQDAGPSQQQHLAVTNSLHKEQHENLFIPFFFFDQIEVYG